VICPYAWPPPLLHRHIVGSFDAFYTDIGKSLQLEKYHGTSQWRHERNPTGTQQCSGAELRLPAFNGISSTMLALGLARYPFFADIPKSIRTTRRIRGLLCELSLEAAIRTTAFRGTLLYPIVLRGCHGHTNSDSGLQPFF